MNTKSLFIGLVLACSPVALAACGSDDKADVVDNGKVISRIDLSGEGTIAKGSQQQLKAVVLYSDGSSKDISDGSEATWNTSDASVLTVSKTGQVEGVKTGTATVSITYQSTKETKDILVTP